MSKNDTPQPRCAEAKREMVRSFAAFAGGYKRPAWPTEMFLELSNVCNINCAMCGTFSKLNRPRQTPAALERGFFRRDFLDKLAPLGQHALWLHCFGVGEPTIHPEFKDMIVCLARYEAMLHFVTNGTKMDEKLCRLLVDQRVAQVNVSISGSNQCDYESIYIGGSFTKVIEGMRRLTRFKQEAGSNYPRLVVNSLGFEHHLQTLEEFVALMADCGVEQIRLNPVRVVPRAAVLLPHIAVFRPWEEGKILERAKTLAARLGVVLQSGSFERTRVKSEAEYDEAKQRIAAGSLAKPTFVPLDALKNHQAGDFVQDERPRPEPPALLGLSVNEIRHRLRRKEGAAAGLRPDLLCFQPFTTMYVRQGGKVKPCCFFSNRESALGDISTADARGIWRGDPYRILRNGALRCCYPAACRSCIAGGIAPFFHGVDEAMKSYNAWFRAGFGSNIFGDEEIAALSALGSNWDIAQRHLAAAGPADAGCGASAGGSGQIQE